MRNINKRKRRKGERKNRIKNFKKTRDINRSKRGETKMDERKGRGNKNENIYEKKGEGKQNMERKT